MRILCANFSVSTALITLILIATSIFICIIALLGLHIKIYWMVSSIVSHNRLRDNSLSETFTSISTLVTIVRINMAAICAFYLPLVFFTLLHCRICPQFGMANSQATLHILMCWLMVKPVIMAPLHVAKTSQIFQILSRYLFCCVNRSLTMRNSSQDTATHSSQADLIESTTSSRVPSAPGNTNSSNSSLVDSLSSHYECRRCGHVNPVFYDSDVNLAPLKKPWFTKTSGGTPNPTIIIEPPNDVRQVDVRL